MYGNNDSFQGSESGPYGASYEHYRAQQLGENGGYGAPPPPTRQIPPEPKRPKKGKKVAGYVAAVVAVSMVSGMAGGGTAYLLLREPESQIQQVQTTQEIPIAAESGPSTLNVTSYGTNDIAAIVSKASASVVEITTEVRAFSPFFGEQMAEGSGSGVVFTQDGYIITNDHVVEDASAITVRTQDGSEYSAALIGTDSQTDLALLKIDATGLQPVSFADSDLIEVGELAVAIGNPLGTLGGTVTEGIISAKNRELTIGNETMNLLQTSAAVNPGNSGGGLFNANGDLVGVVNAKSSGSDIEGLGFAIPSNTVKAVAEDLMQHGFVTGRPQLGISVVEINDLQSARRYRLTESGVYVAEVNVENGLESGDRFVSINGETIDSYNDIKTILSQSSVGDVLEIVVKRDGKEMTVQVTLQEQEPEFEQELPQSAEL